MDGLERAGAVRGQPQSTTSCSYGMGRFLPRATPFADCMQGGGAGGYPSYASDWGLMQGMYSHHLGVDRSLNGFRTSASHYFPVTPSPKDLASPYPPQPPPPRTGGYDSMTNGTYLCASSPSPSSTCLSPELDKKRKQTQRCARPLQAGPECQAPQGADSVHQTSDHGAGEGVRVAQLPDATEALRAGCGTRPHRATGQGVVPKPADEVEAGEGN